VSLSTQAGPVGSSALDRVPLEEVESLVDVCPVLGSHAAFLRAFFAAFAAFLAAFLRALSRSLSRNGTGQRLHWGFERQHFFLSFLPTG